MTDKMFFGNKETFAIEIGSTKKPDLYLLCFWIKNIKVGRFTKGARLNLSISAYNNFVINKDKFYAPVFDNMSPNEILFYLWGRDPVTMDENVTNEEAQKRLKHYLSLLYFGDQFLNSNMGMLFLFKSPNVIILMEKGVQNVTIEQINFEYFKKVFEEYVSYCENNRLL